MKISRWIPVALAILCLGETTPSQPDGRKVAEELLTLTNVEKTISDMRAQMGQMLTAQLSSMNVPDEMRDKEAAFQKRILDLVFEEMSFAKMKSDYVDAYASTFTVDELAGLVEFYKGPVGRAFADKMPALTKRILEISQERTQTLMPRIQKMTADFIADLNKPASQK